MSIVLFALIGAATKAGTAYWICYGVYCAIGLIDLIRKLYDEFND
jgi:hypothetical protein